MVGHKQAAQHNVDVMNGYTGASQYDTDGQPTYLRRREVMVLA